MDVLLFTVKLKLCYDRSGPAHLTPVVCMVEHRDTQTNFVLGKYLSVHFLFRIYTLLVIKKYCIVFIQPICVLFSVPIMKNKKPRDIESCGFLKHY